MNSKTPQLYFKTIACLLPALVLSATTAFAQPPSAANPPGSGGSAAANPLTSAQQEAVGAMNQSLTPLVTAATSARNELTAASLSVPRDEAAIRARRDALVTAELALASARAERFAGLQNSANRLSDAQVAALIAQTGQPAGGRGPGRGSPGPGRGPLVNPQGVGLDAARKETATLVTAPGTAVGLFAAEPMVVNPANMDIDARGRVWVTEGANYRSIPHAREGGDRIMILEDTNGDGTADKSTVFYQDPSVNTALGVMVLEDNKAIVSLAPYMFLLTDTDNDSVADKREVLFEVIGDANSDHALHTALFGPDGKLYFNFGNAIRELRRPAPGLVVPLHGPVPAHESATVIDRDGKAVRGNGQPYRQGMVFRSNLDGSNVETLAWNFRNNYELAVDSFGSMWQSDNDDDGNTSARINYLMKGGNYGYHDELTGAGWRVAYTAAGSASDPAVRAAFHWHQTDPGVVPNLLVTGLGSPTGITTYEGSLLPASFRNQVIHADGSPGTVRAYPVTRAGAGFTATMLPLLTPAKPQDWYRPSDVTVAPDGALFVADWNDSAVGGHTMADRVLPTLTGRVYRVAPPGNRPAVPALNLNTAAGAVAALQSPNMNTRYLAWTRLHALQAGAEAELLKVWKDRTNDRMRARALFLLSRIKGSEKKYLDEAARDASEDIRITALRAAEAAGVDVIPYVRMMVRDSSAHVRREAALFLRHNPSPEVPVLWTTLAQQHDGKDRWYLEALGIGADQRWNDCLAAWQAAVKNDLSTAAARDIVWRSRGTKTPELVVAISQSPSTAEAEKTRLLRTLDYVTGPEKEAALIKLLTP